MAQIEDRNASKSVNIELNLIPFIDLMCVCITFLLITAVWTQVSLIQLGTSVHGKKTEDVELNPEPLDMVAFRFDIKRSGYFLNLGLKVTEIPKLNGEFDQTSLKDELWRIKEIYPQKKDVVITMEDNLPYRQMIHAMDELIIAGFSQIGIATGVVR